MTNKFRYFIANWKMYGDLNSLKSIDKVIKFTKLYNKKRFRVVYCPPYTLLDAFSAKLKNSFISLGAQNCHAENEYGAFTGNINAKMVKNLGAKYVIIGHSESRTSGDNDELINKKINSALKQKLIVVFCIGETFTQKKRKLTNKILKKQITKGLKGLKKNSRIIIAYEPVWSIGTGIIPKNSELDNNINFINKVIKNYTKLKKVKILYGGSVNPKNIYSLNMINSINGYLIGGASQNAKKLIDIVKKTYN
jgi:triosephosphate isomerase